MYASLFNDMAIVNVKRLTLLMHTVQRECQASAADMKSIS